MSVSFSCARKCFRLLADAIVLRHSLKNWPHVPMLLSNGILRSVPPFELFLLPPTLECVYNVYTCIHFHCVTFNVKKN